MPKPSLSRPWRIRDRANGDLLDDAFYSEADAETFRTSALAEYADEYEVIAYYDDLLLGPQGSPHARNLKSVLVLPRYDVPFFRDCQDSFVDLVARRLASVEGFSHLSRGQRFVIASVIFNRKAGRPADEVGRLIGWDQIKRPVLQRIEHGAKRVWAITRDGGPVDPRGSVAPYAPIEIKDEA